MDNVMLLPAVSFIAAVVGSIIGSVLGISIFIWWAAPFVNDNE